MVRWDRWIIGLAAAAALVMAGAGARAERDVVYSGRYYYPPNGPRSESRWHLYRINPDGSGRTQITRGECDDSFPAWSPDGRQIAFLRGSGGDAVGAKDTLCVMGANGGQARQLALRLNASEVDALRWLPDGRTIAVLPASWSDAMATWLVDARSGQARTLTGVRFYAPSPDGSAVYVGRVKGGDTLEWPRAGRQVGVAAPVRFPVWLDGKTVAGVMDGELAGRVALLGTDGRVKRTVDVQLAPRQSGPDARGYWPSGLEAVPGHPGEVVYLNNEHNSTVGFQNGYYLVDLASGKARKLCSGRFLAWGPDGRRYCMAPGRDLGPYGRKANGEARTVWVAPLKMGTRESGPRAITPGTVWVIGGDWRRVAKGAGVGISRVSGRQKHRVARKRDADETPAARSGNISRRV